MGSIVVIGASAGGVEALSTLVRGLPAGFTAPVCIAQHIGTKVSRLTDVLGRASVLRVSWARDDAPLCAGTIHIAPPGRHLLINRTTTELTDGPREHHSRPAIDPLFRSAATAFGVDAIGVILTGRLSDGSAGLYEIKRHGGTAIVQDPTDAEHADMPGSALEQVAIDHCIPLDDIPALLVRLVGAADAARAEAERARVCPDCGGTTTCGLPDGRVAMACCLRRFATDESRASFERTRLDDSADTLISDLRDHAATCRRIAEASADDSAVRWHDAADEADQRFELVRATFDGPWQ